jgi:hypothetical protein
MKKQQIEYKKTCKLCEKMGYEPEYTFSAKDIVMTSNNHPMVKCPNNHGSFLKNSDYHKILNGEPID